ncbi:hypothetical protein FBUS_07355 [Fasciolopsis buskii]|uniref:Uncharacterized protein n=1 Tax=Fasciolopsis buskii TaxID=27845 RepID=A0A8E0RY89_9TREM|nr:hypothetical protein FBUS_07355 [Fasciolopsis buski]
MYYVGVKIAPPYVLYCRFLLHPNCIIRSNVKFLVSEATIPDNKLSHLCCRSSLIHLCTSLPKRCLTTQARRFSAFMDPPWTLAGSLHQRYKPNKWTRLNLCLLIGGSRLIGYRSGHALTPNLVLFLCGCTGIYAGRDSGMDHVIKVTHSTRGMAVLAADTEEQALVWIRVSALALTVIDPPLFIIIIETIVDHLRNTGTGNGITRSDLETKLEADKLLENQGEPVSFEKTIRASCEFKSVSS